MGVDYGFSSPRSVSSGVRLALWPWTVWWASAWTSGRSQWLRRGSAKSYFMTAHDNICESISEKPNNRGFSCILSQTLVWGFIYATFQFTLEGCPANDRIRPRHWLLEPPTSLQFLWCSVVRCGFFPVIIVSVFLNLPQMGQNGPMVQLLLLLFFFFFLLPINFFEPKCINNNSLPNSDWWICVNSM